MGYPPHIGDYSDTQRSQVMSNFASKISMARNGQSEVVGELLEPYRNYLRMLAASQMGHPVGKRVSPSDIVQDTMLAAHRDLGDFQGTTSAEFGSWLRTILARCLLRAIERNVTAEKRDVRREVSIEGLRTSIESSCAGIGAFLVQQHQETPSQIVSGEEESLRVANFVAKLPEDYQKVIALRNFGSMRFDEIAIQMNRSPQAVRLLWLRAINRLRTAYFAGSS